LLPKPGVGVNGGAGEGQSFRHRVGFLEPETGGRAREKR